MKKSAFVIPGFLLLLVAALTWPAQVCAQQCQLVLPNCSPNAATQGGLYGSCQSRMEAAQVRFNECIRRREEENRRKSSGGSGGTGTAPATNCAASGMLVTLKGNCVPDPHFVLAIQHERLNSALLGAALDGTTAEVSALLKQGAEADLVNFGDTPLRNAVLGGHIDTVRVLLDAGARINVRGRDDKTALQLAEEHGYLDIVALLKSRGTRAVASSLSRLDLNQRLHQAALQETAEEVSALLKQGADPNDSWSGTFRETPLYDAVLGNHIDTVRVLLDAGANVDAVGGIGKTALQLAEEQKHLDIVELLKNPATYAVAASAPASAPPVAAPATPPSAVPSPRTDLDAKLLDAAQFGRTAEVSALLKQGANPNAKYSDGGMALGRAAYNGHIDAVRALLDGGADVNAKEYGGFTALMEAASGGQTDIVRALLDKGADINAKTNDGRTALTFAENKYPRLTAFLKSRGAH